MEQFKHRLCLALGGMTVAELEDRMSQAELERWMRFEAMEPFLPFRVDLIGGLICSTLANVHKAKHVAAFDARMFMPLMIKAEREEEEKVLRTQTKNAVDDVEVTLQMAVLRFGGSVRG